MSDLDRVIRRNTLILAATLAVNSAVVQLVAAVSSLTFVLVTGVKGLLGLGPAIFLVAAAVTGAVAGRAMDRFGRRPVLIIGFLVGGSGCALTALGTHVTSTVAVIAGFVLTGSSSAAALLVRTAAGDMYPPLRRARGISYVLFGSVFGAILGPTVFSPLFAGKDLEADALTVPWLAAAGISLGSAAIVALVRPDTKKIAELVTPSEANAPILPRASLAEILRRPGVMTAMLAAFASFGVMVSVMNLTGYAVVEKHHHAQHDVFPIIGAHVLGMYALVLFVGALIDRIGRTPSLASGLVVMGVSALGLQRLRRSDVRGCARAARRIDARDAWSGGHGDRRRNPRHCAGSLDSRTPRSTRFLVISLHSPPADASCSPFLCDEDLQRQAGRDRTRLVRRGCRGKDPRQARDNDRGHAARQEQASVHAARRYGRFRGRRQRGADSRNRKQTRPEALPPALGLPGRTQVAPAARAARATADRGASQGGQGDAPTQPAVARTDHEAEDLRRSRPSARGAGAQAAAAGGLKWHKRRSRSTRAPGSGRRLLRA